jgi:cell division protein FtsW
MQHARKTLMHAFRGAGRSDKRSKPQKKRFGSVDTWLVIVIIFLLITGIVMVYNSSVALAIRDFSDQYHFVRDQLRWLVIGLIALVIFSRIDYRVWYKLAFPMLIGTIVLLVAVFLPGIGIRVLGASRWINFGFFVLQPAEVAKLTLAIYLSAWFSKPEKGRLPAFLLLTGMVVGLVVLEPDLGTSIVLMVIAVTMYFNSGAPIAHFVALIPALAGAVFALGVTSPYRMRRIMTFLDPQSDPLGASYQIRQALLAIGSGGLFGIGLGKSRQKYQYLPEANTDSIFAILAEEVGFFGSLFLIALFVILVWRGISIARRADDTFGRLLALSITAWIGVQSVFNLAAMVSLIPLTGIPLPLISYGGSSLVVTLSALGILLNISKR